MTTTEKTIVGQECRFVVFAENPHIQDDLHIVKLNTHYSDGTTAPTLKFIKNFKRPFWITKPALQKYTDKKEWEPLSRLNRYTTTQSHLEHAVKKAIGMGYSNKRLAEICDSPYIYGSDITSTAIIKKAYKDKYADTPATPFSMAVTDIETDVVHGTNKIIIASVTSKTTVYVTILASFLQPYIDKTGDSLQDIRDKLWKISTEHPTFSQVLKDRNITHFEVILLTEEVDLTLHVLAKLHDIKADFITGWNVMDFDLQKYIKTLTDANINPADVLCDPSVPKEYRFAKLKLGQAKRITASNKLMSFTPEKRWHTLYCPSSSYWVDAMCAYYRCREGSAEEPKYSLDYMLEKHEIPTKLKFGNTVSSDGIEWHREMQTKHPLEYIAYNIYDCIAVELLEEKIQDIPVLLNVYSDTSDFDRLESQPKRKVDDLHWVALENQHVIGTRGANLGDELDDDTTDPSGWIIMLKAERVADNGLCLISEDKTLRTTFRVYAFDLDLAGSYPSNSLVANVSKGTTVSELVSINGRSIDEPEVRLFTLNLHASDTNALELSETFGMPDADEVLKWYVSTYK